MFDLEADPGETRDVSGNPQHRRQREAFHAELTSYFTERARPQLKNGERLPGRSFLRKCTPGSWYIVCGKPVMNRRQFLKTTAAAGCIFAEPYQRLAAALQKKVKITDVKMMIVRGTWDWNLIKIETDSGLYGIGEAYWGWGVKDLVLNKLKPIIVGEDPLNVDKLYTKMLMQSAGAGAIGGRHRDCRQRHRDRAVGSVRAHSADARLQSAGRPFPRQRPLLPHAAGRRRTWRTWARGARRSQEARAEKWGWTAFKFQGDGVPVEGRSRSSANPVTIPTRAT